MNQAIIDTENMRKKIEKSSNTISDQTTKKLVEEWLMNYYCPFSNLFIEDEKSQAALNYLKTSSANGRLIRKKWLSNFNTIIKAIKDKKYSSSKKYFNDSSKHKEIIDTDLLTIIKTIDDKVYILCEELNTNWSFGKCWNACGILMRVILERSLDIKDKEIKIKDGLKNKINHCLSTNIFGKSIKEAIKKLDHSTKITGDIVAHDSNIVLIEDDIVLAIIPFRILLKDIFKDK